MRYRERAAALAGVVLWQRSSSGAPEGIPIMPDGCLDLVWDGRRLFVAGPDTAIRWHQGRAGTTYVGLRCCGGIGPALLGVPADEVRDQTPNLDELWSAREGRVLTERVETQPSLALESWAVERAARCNVDPFGMRVLSLVNAGSSVTAMATRLGLSTRQLHRRCLPTFGYGPRHLARVMRFGRALEAIRAGTPLAQVAAECRYADQAHLTREVRALAGTTPASLWREPYTEGSTANRSTGPYAEGSTANRSTGRPSGSRTTA